ACNVAVGYVAPADRRRNYVLATNGLYADGFSKACSNQKSSPGGFDLSGYDAMIEMRRRRFDRPRHGDAGGLGPPHLTRRVAFLSRRVAGKKKRACCKKGIWRYGDPCHECPPPSGVRAEHQISAAVAIS